MSQLKLSPLVLLLLIVGCAGPIGTIRVSQAPPAPVVTAFDGSYQTTIRSLRSFGADQETAWCDTPGQPVVTVRNGKFDYAVPHPNVPGNATPKYSATIAPDGTFFGQIIEGTLNGQVQGNHIEGRIDGSACIYAFSGIRT
jgi:hypothetical protein